MTNQPTASPWWHTTTPTRCVWVCVTTEMPLITGTHRVSADGPRTIVNVRAFSAHDRDSTARARRYADEHTGIDLTRKVYQSTTTQLCEVEQ